MWALCDSTVVIEVTCFPNNSDMTGTVEMRHTTFFFFICVGDIKRLKTYHDITNGSMDTSVITVNSFGTKQMFWFNFDLLIIGDVSGLCHFGPARLFARY